MLTVSGRPLLALKDSLCPVLDLSPCSYAQALAWMISPDLHFPSPLLRAGPLSPRTLHLSAPLACMSSAWFHECCVFFHLLWLLEKSIYTDTNTETFTFTFTFTYTYIYTYLYL